jgi:hypothetical protein
VRIWLNEVGRGGEGEKENGRETIRRAVKKKAGMEKVGNR